MILIGFTGSAGSGKDTAAQMLLDKYEEHISMGTMAFGDGVKQCVSKVFQVPIGIFYNQKEKMKINPIWNISHRAMLQLLGTDFARNMIDEDFWIKWAQAPYEKAIAEGTSILLVTDIRFPNEAAWIKENGGYVIRIQRGNTGILSGNELVHESETAMHTIQSDYTIDNRLGLKELEIMVLNVFGDITQKIRES